MQLFAAILATLWIFVPPQFIKADIKSALKKTYANSLLKKPLPIANFKKPYFGLLKKSLVNATRPKQATLKRWMGKSMEYIKSQPVQRYTVNYNNDLIDGQTEQPEQQSNDLVDGSMAPFDREEPHEEQSFQGLKELKLPKAGGLPAENNPQQNDQALMFASDIAQYLKPGIGDDPSDMPGGLKSYGGSLNGVGLPITGKLHSTKLTPVASFSEQAPPPTAVIPEVIAESIRTDSTSATKLLDEMPGKISEVSASLADASKAFTGAGESSMIVSNANSDASSSLSTPDSSVASQSDAIDSENSASSSSSSSDSEKSKDSKGSEGKSSEAISNDSDVKEKKLSASKNGDDASDGKGKDSALTEKTHANATSDDEDENEKTPSKVKEKLVSSLREALLENVKEMLNGENSKQLLEEAQAVSGDSTSSNSSKSSGKDDEEEGSAESVTPNKNFAESHYIDDVREDKDTSDSDTKDLDNKQSGNLLESNLMKIDKRKLVHLLATLMKRYKSSGTSSSSDSSSDSSSSSSEGSTEKEKGSKADKSSEKAASKDAASAELDGKHEEKDNEKVEDETIQALKKGEDKEDEGKDDEGPFPPSREMKLKKGEHNEKAQSRTAGFVTELFDPYAQIGMTDPKVSGNPAKSSKKVDVAAVSRHSVHINLFGDNYSTKEKDAVKQDEGYKLSKEFEGKMEKESQRAEELVNENVEKQKEKLNGEQSRAQSKEGLENEQLIKEAKGLAKPAEQQTIQHEVESKITESANLPGLGLLENVKIDHVVPQSLDETGLVKGHSSNSNEKEDGGAKLSGDKDRQLEINESPKHAGRVDTMKNSKEEKDQEKTDAEKESESVAAELAKEKEELKRLKEQEKFEKAKEHELKMANAELEAKDDKEKEAFLEKVKQQTDKDNRAEESKKMEKDGKGEAESSKEFVSVHEKLKGDDVKLTEKLASLAGVGTSGFASDAKESDKQLDKNEKDTTENSKVISDEKEKYTKEKEIKNLVGGNKEKQGEESEKEQTAEVDEKKKGKEDEGNGEGRLKEKNIKGKFKEDSDKEESKENNGKEQLKGNTEKEQKLEKIKENEEMKSERIKELEKEEKALKSKDNQSPSSKEDEDKDKTMDAKQKEKENMRENSKEKEMSSDQDANKVESNKEKEQKEKEDKLNEIHRYGKLKDTSNQNAAADDSNNLSKEKANTNEKDLKITIAAETEKEKNTVDAISGKSSPAKEKDDQKERVQQSLVKDKDEEKTKTMVKERKNEEMVNKEKDTNDDSKEEKEFTKEGSKEKESEERKDVKTKEKNVTDETQKEEKQVKDSKDKKLIEKYNAEVKTPLTSEHHRYIHIVSPEMVHAITAKIPAHIIESEREAAKYVQESSLLSQEQTIKAGDFKGLKAEKGKGLGTAHASAEKDASVEQTKEKNKASLTEDNHKTPVEEKISVEAKEDGKLSGPSVEAKEDGKLSGTPVEAKEDGKLSDKLPVEAKEDSKLSDKLTVEGKEEGKLSRDTSQGSLVGMHMTNDKEKEQRIKDHETKEKNEEFMSIDGPNIETLIEHMEERMRQKKKQEKDISFNKDPSTKTTVVVTAKDPSRIKKNDDVYSHIGSSDPNVKRRHILKKVKKHAHHHRFKVVKS